MGKFNELVGQSSSDACIDCPFFFGDRTGIWRSHLSALHAISLNTTWTHLRTYANSVQREMLTFLQLGVMPIIFVIICSYLYKLLSHDDGNGNENGEGSFGAGKFANRGLVATKSSRAVEKAFTARHYATGMGITVSHFVTINFTFPSIDLINLPGAVKDFLGAIIGFFSFDLNSIVGPPECVIEGSKTEVLLLSLLSPFVLVFVFFLWHSHCGCAPKRLLRKDQKRIGQFCCCISGLLCIRLCIRCVFDALTTCTDALAALAAPQVDGSEDGINESKVERRESTADSIGGEDDDPREKCFAIWLGNQDGIEAVVTYIWVLCVIPVLMKQIFISVDCTKGDNGEFTLDIDPTLSCPFNVLSMTGVYSFLCFIAFPLSTSIKHIYGCTRPRYMSHSCDDPHCDDCSKRRRFGFLFEKFKEDDSLWELVSLTRSIFIAAIGTFFTKRIVIQLSACIACNTTVLIGVLIRKPFLPAGTQGRPKNCKQCAGMLGINNTLEALLLLAEIFLWSAGLGNSIRRRKTTIFAFVEWSGFTCFVVGFAYCAKEIVKLYVFSRCKKCKSKDESSDVDIEMTATTGATKLETRARSMRKGGEVTVPNPLLQPGDKDKLASL